MGMEGWYEGVGGERHFGKKKQRNKNAVRANDSTAFISLRRTYRFQSLHIQRL